ncbi:MAG: hypothetical protein ACHQHN_01635 [Sphingobacteriales bacterium]
MIKLTQIVALCIFCCILLAIKALDSGKYQNDLAERNLKGKVKLCIEFVYHEPKINDTIDTGWVYKTISSFDLKGKSQSWYLCDGAPNYRTEMAMTSSYDKEGREVDTKDSLGKIISRSTYNRNAENNLIESYWSELSSKPMFKIIYNHFGRRDSMYCYNIAGGFMGTVIYRYNKSNDMIEELRYSRNSKLTGKEIYYYNKTNLKISEMHYDSLGTKTGKMTYAYDDYGNMIMEIDSNNMYIGGERVFSVDPNNKDILIFKCSYGNFDNHHNWLREDMFYNNKIVKTFKRKIDYYP